MALNYAVLFPGQGSQFVGMGAELFDARPDILGERVDEVLGWSLRRVCLEGPEELLVRTEHAQPALFCLSYVLWLELADRFPAPPRRPPPAIRWGNTRLWPPPGCSNSKRPCRWWRPGGGRWARPPTPRSRG